MASPVEQRRIRLKNDHQTMLNIQRDWLKWTGSKGSAPYFEQYDIELNLRTIVSNRPTYADKHRIRITLPATYPRHSAPSAVFQSHPLPFHPNWYTDGRWCHGSWLAHESLGAFVIRMIQTLQYNSDITNERSPANGDANRWYISNRSKGYFPCDTTELPDPTTSRMNLSTNTGIIKKKFEIKEKPQKAFKIVGTNETES